MMPRKGNLQTILYNKDMFCEDFLRFYWCLARRSHQFWVINMTQGFQRDLFVEHHVKVCDLPLITVS